MKVYCNICDKEVEPIDNKCPNCKLVFEDNTEKNIENTINPIEQPTNTIAVAIKIVAWIILVVGFIISFILGKDAYGDISFGSLISIWLIFGASFLFTYALGEIIDILHDIRRKLYTNKK